MRTRVIAVGHPFGGDDAVAFAVAGALKSRGVPPGVEVAEISDPTRIPHLISGVDRVIVVDAVMGEGKPGEILLLTPEALETGTLRPVSSHGIGVIESLRMGHLLLPEGERPEISLLGIRIPEARRFTEGLTPEVASAVPKAATRVESL
ncbi:MAG: hydrogenase maturation protease, partial [Nitrospirae bacterium]|nr:hydrogenase maturation protease [Nitrospirota bacterium]